VLTCRAGLYSINLGFPQKNMTIFSIIALLLTFAAILSFINYRFFKLPTTIGLMTMSPLLSLILIILNKLGLKFEQQAQQILHTIDFKNTLLHGMLSFLLFAGALHVNLNDLAQQKRVIGLLTTVGLIISTFLVGILSWYSFTALGVTIPFIYCLLFGALISPTDPIAVLGILKKAGAPKSLETKIVGESLFNDGVAVVIFLIFLEMAGGGEALSPQNVVLLFASEALGGILLGLISGYSTYWMLKQVDNYQVEVLLTLALATGGYALAETLHVSAPITIVVAGLLIGNHGRLFAMSQKTRLHLDTFWELVDDILNAVLFVLIGLEVLVLTFTKVYFAAGLLAIPIVLFSRFISVNIPLLILKPFREFSPNAVRILTWGGLRGGISVAMALALPTNEFRHLLLAATYAVVIFSIVVQGLTLNKLVHKKKS
jgi:CPA1 family monovalent cation:H+ antiporter